MDTCSAQALVIKPHSKDMSLPRHKATRSSSDYKQPSLWDVKPAMQATAVAGQYPKGFVDWAIRLMGANRSGMVHVCSGAQGAEIGGVRVDIRRDAYPDVRADGRSLPFCNKAFNFGLCDPPYTEEYARNLYGTDYPRPAHLLAELGRVCEYGIGFLHFIVPNPPRGWQIASIHGVSLGCGYAMRAFTHFRRA